jgi:hypothetical protein
MKKKNSYSGAVKNWFIFYEKENRNKYVAIFPRHEPEPQLHEKDAFPFGPALKIIH